ncbi:phage holin family protein [Azonexus caeni]|jgi:uncharacterized membrane protein YqjE|uniref:phage holin family protein n=1 Tax=Azonexus caeni TaxID=266126 RepID=UPI003A878164
MTGSESGEDGREGLFAALKNSAATLLSIGRTRAELLVLEIEEEKYRLIALWSKAIGAAFLLTLAVIMAVFSLALAFWEQRVLVFGAFALLFFLGAAALILALRRQVRAPSQLFRSSLAELDTDLAQLRGQRRE